jgi:hypothetical protein
MSADDDSPLNASSKLLVDELKACGKTSVKTELASVVWEEGTAWYDRKSERFLRCVTLPEHPELLTRHEVQEAPPDVLVTNYSMLEYMLMRPLERSIFDETRAWLKANPAETLLLVLDEAHYIEGPAVLRSRF